MRKLILKMSISVDGFVAGPNGEADWMFKSMGDEAAAWVVDTLWQAGTHIMGSRTFDVMATYWPTSKLPFAAPMNEIPKVVFSKSNPIENISKGDTTNENLSSWLNAGVASGDLVEEINKLKQQPGKDILVHGGASFVQSLAKYGLIDEYRLMVHPVVLGTGLALFSAIPKPVDFKLVSITPFKSGAAAHVYQLA